VTGLLFDTCILIDVLRRRPEAIDLVAQAGNSAAISVVTVQELLVGMRAKEQDAIEKLIGLFRIIPVDEEIARQAGTWMRQYLKSHRLESNDSFIAATVEVFDQKLITLNLKHFPMFSELERPY